MTEDLSVRAIPLQYGEERERLQAFLADKGLRFEADIERAFGVFDTGDTLLGCGCAAGALLKCFAVTEALRGQNALGPLVSALVQDRFFNGYYDLYVITRAGNVPLFTACGFFPVAETDRIAMLETRADGPEAFARPLFQAGDENREIGAIIMNGNPFTRGHRHLVDRKSVV